MSDFVEQNSAIMSFNTSESWIMLSPIEQSIKQKIEAVGTPLKDWNITISYGIKTGLNEAFIISEEKRNEILENCKTEEERERTAELIRPVLRGKDIKRYGYNYCNLYVILAYFGIYKKIEKEYPSLFGYLKGWEEKLKNRGQCRYTSSKKVNIDADYPGQHHWIELDNNPTLEKLEEFNKPKLVYKEISEEISFALSLNKEFLSNSAYSISGPSIDILKYLLDVLNSKLINWYCRTFFISLENNAVRMLSVSVNTIPIIRPTQKLTLEKLLNLDKSKIDSTIFDMYGLSKTEQKYIDEFCQIFC